MFNHKHTKIASSQFLNGFSIKYDIFFINVMRFPCKKQLVIGMKSSG